MEVKIDKFDHFGNGIGKKDDKVIFIKKALPNEVVDVILNKEKKHYNFGVINEVITPNENRVESICPYYDECGGCNFLHITYDIEKEFKITKGKELISKDARFYDTSEFNYRNKVIFHGKEGKLGYYKENSNDLVCLDTCLLLDKKILEVYHQILENCTDFYIKELMIRKTSLNEVMVSIKGDVDKSVLLDIPNINSLYINDKLIKGNSYIIENMNDINFRIYPTSFFQVNYEMMKEMYKIVINYCRVEFSVSIYFFN